MTTDVNIMEEMLERATNPCRDTVDELGVQMFCMVAKNNIQKAQELIVTKVQSRNVTEATRAIALLEECMSKCGSEFQEEVAKFRFLNYLIRLVSKKYEGAETPQAIKKRIMECLLLWTTSHPQRAKIREAYDNLNKEGDVEHGNTMASMVAAVKRDSILGGDDELVRRLVNSNDPENYKRANLLIQYRVNQEARHTEFRLQQKIELQEVENTVALLNQMLEAYESENGADDVGSETMNLIRELYMACKKHKTILQRLLEMNDNADSDLTADTLSTNVMLLAVMKRYKNTVVYQKNKEKHTPTHPPASDLAAPNASNDNNISNLLSELFGDPLTVGSADPMSAAEKEKQTKALEELNEIFGSLKPVEEAENTEVLNTNSGSILEPVNVFEQTKKTNGTDEQHQPEKRPFRELREIDELSAALFKQSLPVCLGSFKKESEKVTLNDLAKERTNVHVPSQSVPSAAVSPTEQPEQTIPTTVTEQEKPNDDDLMLDGSNVITAFEKDVTKSLPPPIANHLSDITLDLDDVVPKAEERLLMDDDDVKITLNFTENRPSRHVSVIVLSVLNKSKLPVRDFQFEASVRKPNKVRLLPPTDTQMLPYKPFRPPMPISQVVLLMNPTGQPVDITCIVGYKLGDDPDPIKESITVKDIPFVE